MSNYFLNHFGSEIIAYRIFTVVEFTLLMAFLFTNTKKSFNKKLVLIASIFFLISFLFDYQSFKITEFDSLPTGIESLIIIVLTILNIKENLTRDNILKQSATWINFANLLFFSGSFFLFILSQNNLQNTEFANIYAFSIAILNIIKNGLYSFGILIDKKHVRNSIKIHNYSI